MPSISSGTSTLSIALAFALSVLLHSAALWLPQVQVQLPHNEALPPPLMAKLEPLPKRAANLAPKPATKQKRASPPEPKTESASPAAKLDQPIAAIPEPVAVSAVEAASVAAIPEPTPAASAVAAASAVVVMEEPTVAHPLPKHAQLTFFVYQGSGGFQIGEVKHQFKITGDEYTLKSVTQTTGLARLFKTYQLTQTSRGKVGKQGLQPGAFEEEKNLSGSKQNRGASFDWPSQKLRFPHGGETALPADAQDILSIFYQLSQLPMDGEIIALAVSNSKKLEKYKLVVGAEEEISTPMGKLRALHLRKLHNQGENSFEIWLGLEYRLLPVKYLLVEPSGEVAGEVVISDIRVTVE